MKRYTVYTPLGEWRDIVAPPSEHAKRIVWRRTLGRVRLEDMSATIQ